MGSRRITTHHDGHGLNESIEILAGEPGPGGASHHYVCRVDGKIVAEIQFQEGARHEAGSTPGVVGNAILAIVADQLEAFQAGPYSSRETALALTKVQEAMHWQRHRADERARRGALGKHQK